MNPYVIERLTEERHRDLRRLAGRRMAKPPRPIDALALDRAVLSARLLRPGWTLARLLGRGHPVPAGRPAGTDGDVADPVEDELRRARRLASQLPVPADDAAARPGARYAATLRQLQAALAVLLDPQDAAPAPATTGLPAPSLAAVAARLRSEGVITAPAAQAVEALAAVLTAGAAGQVGDPSVEPAAAATGERLAAYLASRAAGPMRSVRSSSSSRSTTSTNVPPAASTARCLR